MLSKVKNVLGKKSVKIGIVATLSVLVLTSAGFFGYSYYQKEQAKKQIEATRAIIAQTGLALSNEPKKPSEYEIGMNYDEAMKSNKPVFTLFYADWCGYCVKFMPTYQAIALKYGNEIDFAKVNIEDAKYEKVVRNIGIAGFPTVFILDPKYDNKVLISNAQLGSVESISEEIDRYIRIRKILDSKSKK